MASSTADGVFRPSQPLCGDVEFSADIVWTKLASDGITEIQDGPYMLDASSEAI